MELKNVLTPWNWFKKEEEHTSRTQNTLHVTRENPLGRLHQEIEQLFDYFFLGIPLSPFRHMDQGWMGGLMMPKVDIAKKGSTIQFTLAVPGVEEKDKEKDKDIDVSIADGTLTFGGESGMSKRTGTSNPTEWSAPMEFFSGSLRCQPIRMKRLLRPNSKMPLSPARSEDPGAKLAGRKIGNK